MLVPGSRRRAATGLKFNRGRLFVSGAGTGKAFIYDAKTGALIREYQLAHRADVHQRRRGDEGCGLLHRLATGPSSFKLPLGKRGTLPAAAQELALTGDFAAGRRLQPERDRRVTDGQTLIAVQSEHRQALHDLAEQRRDPPRSISAARRW